MILRRLTLPLGGALVAAALLTLALAGPASAQGNQGDFGAYIYEGTCDQLGATALEDVGDLDQDDDAWNVVDQGETAPDAVYGEDDDIAQTIDTLTSADHVVVVRASDDQSAAVIACGAIAGEIDANGALLIQLDEVEGSGFQGRAHIGPNMDDDDDDEQTAVTVAIWMANGTPVATPAS